MNGTEVGQRVQGGEGIRQRGKLPMCMDRKMFREAVR